MVRTCTYPGLGIEFDYAVNAALDLLEDEVIPFTNLSGAASVRGVQRLVLRRFS